MPFEKPGTYSSGLYKKEEKKEAAHEKKAVVQHDEKKATAVKSDEKAKVVVKRKQLTQSEQAMDGFKGRIQAECDRLSSVAKEIEDGTTPRVAEDNARAVARALVTIAEDIAAFENSGATTTV